MIQHPLVEPRTEHGHRSTAGKTRSKVGLFSTILALALHSSSTLGQVAQPYSNNAFEQNSTNKGTVIVSAKWVRKWSCGSFENAQLRSLSFDKVGVPKANNETPPDLLVEDTSWLPATPKFVDYAFIVEPGEYQMSAFDVKVVRSMQDMGHFKPPRSKMIENGESKAGRFTVAAGEVVYIGHFFLDCAYDPMPWRFYAANRQDFDEYVNGIHQQFPKIKPEVVKFRLFETTTMGHPFKLPDESAPTSPPQP